MTHVYAYRCLGGGTRAFASAVEYVILRLFGTLITCTIREQSETNQFPASAVAEQALDPANQSPTNHVCMVDGFVGAGQIQRIINGARQGGSESGALAA